VIIKKLLYIISIFITVFICNNKANAQFKNDIKTHSLFLISESHHSTLKLSKEDSAEYSVKGFQWGFNFGTYFANNATANYYNGTNETNNLNAIIGNDPYTGTWNNTYNYTHDEIKEELGYEFEIAELPERMKYDIAFALGFYVKYNINNNTGFFADFNYVKLKANNIFTLDLYDGYDIAQNLECYINGAEERYDIDLGICKTYGQANRYKPFVELAFNINNTKVKQATAYIESLTHPNKILSYSFLSPYNGYYNLRDDGIGYGVYVGTGIQIILSESFLLYSGVNIQMKQINLGEYKEKYRLQENFFIRLVFKNLISSSQNDA
jgi:hypothetical protein